MDYQNALGYIAFTLNQRRVHFFSSARYEDYLPRSITSLTAAYPYQGLQGEPSLAALKDIATAYREAFILRRIWLRITTFIGVYLGLYEGMVVSELSNCFRWSNKEHAITDALRLYQEHQVNLIPDFFQTKTNHWRFRLAQLCADIAKENTNVLPKQEQNVALISALKRINSEIDKQELCDLTLLIDYYQQLRTQHPEYDKDQRTALEKRILLRVHPDKNLHQPECAELQFKRFFAMKEENSLSSQHLIYDELIARFEQILRRQAAFEAQFYANSEARAKDMEARIKAESEATEARIKAEVDARIKAEVDARIKAENEVTRMQISEITAALKAKGFFASKSTTSVMEDPENAIPLEETGCSRNYK